MLTKRTFMRWEWGGRAIFEFELSKTPFPPSAGQVEVNRDGAIEMFTKKLNISIRNTSQLVFVLSSCMSDSLGQPPMFTEAICT